MSPFIMAKWLLPNVSKKYISLGLFLSFGIACFSWWFLSYSDYYDQQARAYYNQKEFIVSLIKDFNENDKSSNPANFHLLTNTIKLNNTNNTNNEKLARATITLKYDDKTILSQKSSRENYIAEISVSSTPIKNTTNYTYTKNDEQSYGKFKLTYEYRNRPELSTGLIRAIFFSMTDKAVANGARFSKNDDNPWKIYIGRYLYERSTGWWLMFYACFFVAIIISYMLGERDATKQRLLMQKLHAEELHGKNVELDKVNKSLTRFKLMYQKMFKEYEKVGVEANKEILKKVDFTWPTLMATTLKTERHELKNRLLATGLSLSNYEQKLYSEIIGKASKDILDNLRRLPEIIDYRTDSMDLKNIVSDIDKKLDSLINTFHDDADLTFQEINNLSNNVIGKCDINIDRLKSMVENVLTNANKEYRKCAVHSIINNQPYRGKIILSYSAISKEKKDFLCISVKDNAGGIPDAIFQRIYSEPVPSGNSTGSNSKLGEGTMYVAFFAKYMNIEIQKQNWSENDEKGAEISLLVPIIKEEAHD